MSMNTIIVDNEIGFIEFPRSIPSYIYDCINMNYIIERNRYVHINISQLNVLHKFIHF